MSTILPVHPTKESIDSDVAPANPETIIRTPPMYTIIMYNDDYTTMDFVVWVLVTILKLSEADAHQLMLEIHHHGSAKVATLPREIAEMKIHQIRLFAEKEEFPLLVTLEAE